MMQLRNINQEGIDVLWKEQRGNVEEEVLEKYKFEATKQGVCKERCEPLIWQITAKEKKYSPQKRGEDCWARIFSSLTEYGFHRHKGVQAGQTEVEEKFLK